MRRYISNYIKKGILEETPNDFKTNKFHYLPYRPVVKEDLKAMKVATVFHATEKHKN